MSPFVGRFFQGEALRKILDISKFDIYRFSPIDGATDCEKNALVVRGKCSALSLKTSKQFKKENPG